MRILSYVLSPLVDFSGFYYFYLMSYSACASETWTLCGDCALSLSLTQVAVRSYEAALAHDPSNAKALCGISAGLRLIDISRNETVRSQNAIENLTRALSAYPHLTKVADIFRHLAECYLLIGLNDQAHQSVQTALELSPESPTLWLLNAQTLIRSNARQHATSALTHCLMLLSNRNLSQDNDIETARAAHAELAAIAAADGNVDASIAELTATLALPPPPLAQTEEYIALWCALATAKERARDLEGAIQACEGAERAVGRLPRILLTHAYLLLVREEPQPDVAITLLHEVVGDVEHEKHQNENQKEQTEQTEQSGQNSQNVSENGSPHTKPLKLENWPAEDFLPYFLLGQAYSLLNHPRAAYDAYQVALRRASNSPIAWLAVGKLYLKLKQLPDALAAYSQALRLQMDDGSAGAAAAWDGLSCVYERCDFQLTDAADACDRCAACYRAIGDVDGAQFFEERAKTLIAALRKEVAVPPLRDPVNVPEFLVRDLVALLPSERISYVRGDRDYERQTEEQQQRQEEQRQIQQQQQQQEQQRQIQNQHLINNLHQDQLRIQQHQPQHPNLIRPENPQFAPHSPAGASAVINGSGMSGPAPGVPGRLQASPHQLPPPPHWSPSQPPGMLRGPPGMPMPPGVIQGSPGPQQQMIQGYATSPPPGPNGVPNHPPPPPPGYAYGQYMPMPTMVGMPYPQPVNGWMR